MTRAAFIRLLHHQDKETALHEAVTTLRGGIVAPPAYLADPGRFPEIPGSPFAYWVRDRIRRLFTELPSVERRGCLLKQGLATADDSRFVRAWWEVAVERIVSGSADTTAQEFRAQTHQGKRWVPFAKGGAYSPYYADLHLVVNWERDGEEIKSNVNDEGKVRSNVWMLKDTAQRYFFRPGLTWPRRTNGLSFRPLPAGAIFADKGPAAFLEIESTQATLSLAGIMNSLPFLLLVQTLLGRVALAQSYEVGLIQSVPVPVISLDAVEMISRQSLLAAHIMQELDSAVETSHVFWLPGILQMPGASLAERADSWNHRVVELRARLEELRDALDHMAFRFYGFSDEEVMNTKADQVRLNEAGDGLDDQEEEDIEAEPEGTPGTLGAVLDVVSYVFGVIFGRWDVRLAESPRIPSVHASLFDPLPLCATGALLNDQGLPAAHLEVPDNYPVQIQWNGVLPLDEGHPRDAVRQFREVLATIFPDAYSVEREACLALDSRDLRSALTARFFPYHLSRYNKSKRKAPIYWLLQSHRKSYGLWLYYPHLTSDTLYVALRDYVEPKLGHEQSELDKLRAEYTQDKLAGGRDSRTLARKVESQEELVREIAAFRDEIKAVADAGYDPDLDDGVPINIAPLHRLVPRKEPAKWYQELKAGQYPWSTMSKRYKFR